MRTVYLHEFNILMANKVYLPIASGMLRAYAESIPEIKNNYEFKPFIFIRQKPEHILKIYEQPDILAFSSSLWNHQLNLYLAKQAKQIYPQALVIFGGPEVPQSTDQAAQFLHTYPFIDIIVRAEGEETFAEILIARAQQQSFTAIDGIGFIDQHGQYVHTAERKLLKALELLPSPYLTGLFDYLVDSSDNTEYQVIIETNRGCPFGCSFCFWGNAIKQIRKFGLDRVEAEIQWISQHKIDFVYGADANFGMFKRDLEIAQMLVTAKRNTNYPKAFRVCYGKNAEEYIFTIAQLLSTENMAHGVTLSFQSVDPDTLVNIGRQNIHLETYLNLQRRYHQAKISVYTELILGLPGETYQSFVAGIEDVLQSGLHDQIGIFFCVALTNTEIADPQYAAKYGIQTKRLILIEAHASKIDTYINEYEDIVISTTSMPLADWQKAATIAWLTKLLHGFKLSFFLSLYMHKNLHLDFTKFYEYIVSTCLSDSKNYPVIRTEIEFHKQHLQAMLTGQAQCIFLEEFGDISWLSEEATLLRLADKFSEFYQELYQLAKKFIKDNGISIDDDLLQEIIYFQYLKISSFVAKPHLGIFDYNLPEFFDQLLQDQNPILNKLIKQKQVLQVDVNNFAGNRQEYAKQIIWYGRRDSRILEPSNWHNTSLPA